MDALKKELEFEVIRCLCILKGCILIHQWMTENILVSFNSTDAFSRFFMSQIFDTIVELLPHNPAKFCLTLFQGMSLETIDKQIFLESTCIKLFYTRIFTFNQHKRTNSNNNLRQKWNIAVDTSFRFLEQRLICVLVKCVKKTMLILMQKYKQSFPWSDSYKHQNGSQTRKNLKRRNRMKI